MTNTHDSIIGRSGERGSALIGTVLLLMIMSALAAALGVSGRTETLISRNQRSGVQAQAAAEAGLNHAVELVIPYLSAYGSNGFASPDAAVDALLLGPDGNADTADDGSLEERDGILAAAAIPLGVRLTVADGIDADYEVWVADDVDALDEDGDSDGDVNGRIAIRSRGYAGDGAEVTLEALLSSTPQPAVVSNGNLNIQGNTEITGAGGSVHANVDLDVWGNTEIEHNATAAGVYDESGSADVGGTAAGNQPTIDVAPVIPSNSKALAKYIFKDSGQVVRQSDGAIVCTAIPSNNCTNDYGWEWEGSGDGWSTGSPIRWRHRLRRRAGAVDRQLRDGRRPGGYHHHCRRLDQYHRQPRYDSRFARPHVCDRRRSEDQRQPLDDVRRGGEDPGPRTDRHRRVDADLRTDSGGERGRR